VGEWRNDPAGYRAWAYGSLWLPAALLGGLLVVTLGTEFVLAWQSHQRLQPISRHIGQMVKLQAVNIELQRELVENLRAESDFTAAERGEMAADLKAILDANVLLSGDTGALVAAALGALSDLSKGPKQALILALVQTRKAVELEARAHQALVSKIDRGMALELRIGAITLVLFPVGAALLLYLMRRRILAPLERLSFLMTLLGRRDYTKASVESVDPLLRPLTENYNAMVTRLAELEMEHASRERHLESQVSNATQTLLEQQRSLADTERLAAVGETMARIAHELRNPLAGVKMAFGNLRREMAQESQSQEYTERVNIIAAELDRIIAVLNALLDQSRQNPEPLRDINVGRAVADLLTLVRYQIPVGIVLRQDIPDELVCRLPDAMLRQALLNLILNARHALGEGHGTIALEGRVEQGMLKLSVCDDGPGFPADVLDAGIRAFVSRRADGMGLGLSMVQRFVRAQGGEVKLSNREPHGACVTLELPCGRVDV
jgi:signal transduction histidine kinase